MSVSRDGAWSLVAPATWVVVDDPDGFARDVASEVESPFEAEYSAAIDAWGDLVMGAAFGPDGANLIVVSGPAFPYRDDLAAAVATLRRGFEGVPIELIDVTAEEVDIRGSDYGILGRIEYRFPDEPGSVVSLTLGTGLGNEHITVTVTVPEGDDAEALAVVESIERRG